MRLRLIGAGAGIFGAALAGAALGGMGAGPLAAQDQPLDDIYLFADLSGAAETGGGDEDGYGDFAVTLKLEDGEICYRLSVGEIEEPTAAHVHAGKAGVDGPPVITIEVTGVEADELCMAVDAKLLKKIGSKPGDYYVNVHTADFPAGAVRGQLEA